MDCRIADAFIAMAEHDRKVAHWPRHFPSRRPCQGVREHANGAFAPQPALRLVFPKATADNLYSAPMPSVSHRKPGYIRNHATLDAHLGDAQYPTTTTTKGTHTLYPRHCLIANGSGVITRAAALELSGRGLSVAQIPPSRTISSYSSSGRRCRLSASTISKRSTRIPILPVSVKTVLDSAPRRESLASKAVSKKPGAFGRRLRAKRTFEQPLVYRSQIRWPAVTLRVEFYRKFTMIVVGQ